jgi:hypothetical protein
MQIVGYVLSGLGWCLTVAYLPTLGENLRGWRRFGRWFRSDAGRWAASLAALSLFGLSWLTGVPDWLPFTVLASAVFAAMTLQVFGSRQGVVNWQARCRMWTAESSIAPPDGNLHMFLIVESLDGQERRGVTCEIRRWGRKARFNPTDSLFVPTAAQTPNPRFEAVFPDDFGDAFGMPPRRGRYRTRWYWQDGLTERPLATKRFRLRRSGPKGVLEPD